MMGTGGMMYGGYAWSPLIWLWGLIGLALFLGITVLVWVLVVKFWKELKHKR